MATKSEILSVLKMLTDYQDKKLSEPAVKVYLKTLADIPFELLERAALDHVAENNWFPKVAELRKLASASRLSGKSRHYSEFDADDAVSAAQWKFMQVTDDFNASLRGEITEAELYAKHGDYLRVDEVE
jgi:hypothetical protein